MNPLEPQTQTHESGQTMTSQLERADAERWNGLIDTFPPEERTVPAMLLAQAALYGERPLCSFESVDVSFNQAVSLAQRGAAALEYAGVKKGDSIALFCGNRPEFLEVFLGAAWLGAITVPLNTASKGAQLQHILGNSEARLLISETEFLNRLSVVSLTATKLERILTIPSDGAHPAPDSSLETARWTIPQQSVSGPSEIHPNEPLAILYTSGTTGLSKGVLSPHAQYFWWAANSAKVLELEEGDVLLTTLPLFHVNALSAFFQALITGSTLVIKKRFSASGFLESLLTSKATVTYLLGAMVPILLSTPGTDRDKMHHLRTVLAPGVPAAASVAFTARFGVELIDGFASTETNFVIGSPPSQKRLGTMGQIRPGFHARVVDELDNELQPGVPGELILRAEDPFAFATGYFGMPDKTVEAWRNLWLHTGDRVVCDEDGYFRFIDRIKDVIRRRGENISSYEVEQAIALHPAVKTAAVFPVQSELAEDDVMCAVVLRDKARLSAQELLDHCQELISYFSVPRFVDFVESLPVTENGKIKKFQLRESGITPTTWDREQHGYVVKR
ncbi:crotonobetaine/carnitine-CoA ligase [Arthrobacter bambusae]|uniref:Crotonobetaine/carnitine-CoA ligase n=1 Tax=Arthrobacter bambusae TaxID=1338426 RepID=A0ABV2P1D9_9MICC